MAPTALVERMGQLKAIVTLPFDREQALDMIGRARIGFATSAMTIALDSYMRIGPTDLENYERGDMQRAVEASDGKRRGITDALALTHAERIDNETMITFATNAYHWAIEHNRLVKADDHPAHRFGEGCRNLDRGSYGRHGRSGCHRCCA
jgi:hypothetical protein